MGDGSNERRDDAKRVLLETFSAFGGEDLRDVWLFDQSEYESMYLRPDVEEKVADLDVETFVDNERYGYVTRETYSDLYYTTYEYTVRGFEDYEQFRTFIADGERKVGVFASFDRRDGGGFDFGTLSEEIRAVVADYPTDAFVPE